MKEQKQKKKRRRKERKGGSKGRRRGKQKGNTVCTGHYSKHLISLNLYNNAMVHSMIISVLQNRFLKFEKLMQSLDSR